MSEPLSAMNMVLKNRITVFQVWHKRLDRLNIDTFLLQSFFLFVLASRIAIYRNKLSLSVMRDRICRPLSAFRHLFEANVMLQ